ncbi:MAG: ThuA domain-containing protein [Balneolaceae bacterium]
MLKKFLFILLFFSFSGSALYAHTFKVLIFSKTEGFRHSSIPNGIAAIQQLGLDNNFEVDATEDASMFTLENLLQYDAVIFLSTTGDVLNSEQQTAFEAYISRGKGYVGIHAASDTEYSWEWYGGLVGAYFESHPPGTPTATIEVADKVHPSTSFLSDYWVRTDEWYNYRENPRGNVHVLMTLDESTYTGGNMGYDHPIAWLHDYGGGRAWYTGGGHTEESYSEPDFLNHILGGILYASGDVKGQYVATDDEKFAVTIVDNNPSNPISLAVLPNLDVLYIERGGTIKLRKKDTGIVEVAGTINVFSGFEDGLIGVVLDPDFETNSWVYFFYSPTSENEQRISRFDFVDDKIVSASEKILLEIPTQRNECCHSGGDLEFDSHGNLYIATGDNSNPFADGWSPIDERAGREPWDAQGTSANTNDLRGKILRIKPEDDGTYTIPDGNLFTNAEVGLPEIYVMGTRNPYRMAISNDTGDLIWGEVGPDSREDNENRGPVGYDEFNRTKTGGNFGWPYCIANNIPYNDYNYATGVSSGNYNCAAPVNDSPNNSGATNLPAAEPAWLYYTYGFNENLPEFGDGLRTAIAGGFFEFDSSNTESGGFPQYYDSTLFILEWTRNWIKEVRFDSDGNLLQINPFLDDLVLNRPIDMQFGPDGAMYVIEWGTGFAGNNADARILKIEYVENLGNRPPQAFLQASKTSGGTPLTVDFSASLSSDPDADFLSYSWDFNGDTIEDDSTESPSYTFTDAGSFLVTLTVTDPDGESSVDQVQIVAGNTAPEVTIDYPLNGGFYIEGDAIEYKISVEDAEQGSIGNGIECSAVESEPSIGHDDHSHGAGPSNGCEGEFQTVSHGDGPDNVFYVFNATFEDNGGGANSPITGSALAVLQPKLKQAEHALELFDVQLEATGDVLGGGQNVGFVNDGSALKFGPMNFENIEFFTVRFATQQNPAEVEVRIDELDGPIIAEIQTSITGGWQTYDYFTTDLDNPGGTHDVFFVFKNSTNPNGIGNFNWFEFHGQGMAKENSDSLRGITATYFSNNDFTGDKVVRKEPMIAWNWGSGLPVVGAPRNNFSVRWEGEVESPTTGNYRFSTSTINGSAKVFIDGVEVSSSTQIAMTEGVKKNIKVEYIHTTGDAGMYLRWTGPNPANVVHYNYLTPDFDALMVSNETREINEIPIELKLSQNYPNPFNPSTQIEFSLPENGNVQLKIFNIVGQTVQVLVDEVRSQGSHSVTFDATGLSSGVYFYQLEFEGAIISNKMLLMK